MLCTVPSSTILNRQGLAKRGLAAERVQGGLRRRRALVVHALRTVFSVRVHMLCCVRAPPRRRMFLNAMTYNPPDSPFYTHARNMLHAGEKLVEHAR